MRVPKTGLTKPAVIFDLDGTLVRFKLRVDDAKKEFIETLRSAGIEVPGINDKMTVSEIFDHISKRENGFLNLAKFMFFTIMERYEVEAAKESEPRDGVERLLKKLAERRIKIGVVTNNSRHAASDSLMRVNLYNLIDVLVTRTDTNTLKPDPTNLILASRLLRVPMNMIVYVGDSHNDILAAKKCGMMAVALTGGVSSLEKLVSVKPHMIIERLDELEDLFLTNE
ncbi:MAG: HAD family hydrolase [Aigarchaeota archaeon]|nr:HAD family hydrolase [Aigarchaeota archaeon]MDW8092754.1 HAD family hydrolase [Nitrososphaerota archaeon]